MISQFWRTSYSILYCDKYYESTYRGAGHLWYSKIYVWEMDGHIQASEDKTSVKPYELVFGITVSLSENITCDVMESYVSIGLSEVDVSINGKYITNTFGL